MKVSPLKTLTPPPHYAVGDSPAPAKSRFWDKVARKYAADPISDMVGYERTIECLQQWLRQTDRVLEIGCGTGTTALRLAPLVASYLGTDVSAHMVAIASEKLALHPRAGLQFEAADADAPLANGHQYNAILAFSVLHLVQDLDATAAACAAALVPGGLLISKTPCLAEMNPLIPWLAVPLMRAIGKAPPVHNLNQDDLCAAMKRQGLEIMAVERHAGKGRDVRPFIVARKPVHEHPDWLQSDIHLPQSQLPSRSQEPAHTAKMLTDIQWHSAAEDLVVVRLDHAPNFINSSALVAPRHLNRRRKVGSCVLIFKDTQILLTNIAV